MKRGTKILEYISQKYTTLTAPPCAGDGVRYVIPDLLMYSHSAPIFDPKAENFEITADGEHNE